VDDEKPPFWRYDRAEHRLLFSSQHLFPEFARLYVEALEQFQPVVIHGYPSSVTWMAEALLKCGTERVRPRAVFTASETVLPHQRAIIERAFGCKMFNWYGNGEHIACITECPSGGLHIQSEHSWLEFLDENGRPAAAGVPARLVATTLGNFAMPLIRYDIGDLVTMSDRTCDCGRKTALVEAIEGRVEDYIVGKEGRIFGRLDHIFKDMDAISEAQIVQHESGSIRIRLVRRPHYTEHDTKVLLSAARFRLGSDFRIDLEFVDRIPRRANGKFQFVVTSSRPV
jgi:phenylacetate-CoA ligase